MESYGLRPHFVNETEHPGYLGSQDTYYVGTIKGVGRIYQQTVAAALGLLHLLHSSQDKLILSDYSEALSPLPN